MSIDNAIAIIKATAIPTVQYVKVDSAPTATINSKRIVQGYKVEQSKPVSKPKPIDPTAIVANINQEQHKPAIKYRVVGNSTASIRNAIAIEGIKTRKLRAEQFLFSISEATTVGDIARACRRIDDHEAADRVLKLPDSEAKTLAATMAKEVEKEVQEYTARLKSMGM